MDTKAVLEVLVKAGVTKGAQVRIVYTHASGEERSFEGQLESTFLNQWKEPCFTMSQARSKGAGTFHRTFNPARGNVVSVTVLDPSPGAVVDPSCG